jgi:hypothetical protein
MKQHNFKVGDKIERQSDGLTCIVQRIDPACNNVYGKDFSNNRRNGEEIIHVDQWKVVGAADTVVTRARDFVDSCEKFEVTVLRKITNAPFKADGFGAAFVHRATVDKRSAGLGYSNQVREYLKEIAPTLSVPGDYIAIAVYGDNDTICVEFSTKKVEQPVAVEFSV